MKYYSNDPIIALATARGRASIGVIRISGSNLQCLIKKICSKLIKPRYATFITFKNHSGETLDEGLAIYFPSPYSFTGEDVLEIQCHGSNIALDLLIENCLFLGKNIKLRLANPGEFSERAFLNGKIDLIQAEAIADLIDSSSVLAAKNAAQSLKGKFSEKIHELLDQLTKLRVIIEASLDFPEEEIEVIENYNIFPQLEGVLNQIHSILQTEKYGSLVKNGICVALVGQSNVGKSSLLNMLAGNEIAIVTSIPGTTRDRLKESIQINGIVLNIIDTAGIRKTEDVVEELGIKKTWEAIKEADVILYLKDLSQYNKINLEEDKIIKNIQEEMSKNTCFKIVWNKLDINQVDKRNNSNEYFISSKTGYGINSLKESLLKILDQQEYEGLSLSRKRHVESLLLTKKHIEKALLELSLEKRIDIFAEELRLAQNALGSITGEFLPNDLLNEIFRTFCIGK